MKNAKLETTVHYLWGDARTGRCDVKADEHGLHFDEVAIDLAWPWILRALAELRAQGHDIAIHVPRVTDINLH